MGKLFEELKRRKVVRVAGVYAVVAWLLIQVANNIVPALQLPAWTNTFLVVMLLFGFPVALVLAWAYEITPDGIRSDSGTQSQQRISQSAAILPINYIILGIVLLVAGFQIADRFIAPAQQSTSDQPSSENTGDMRDAATLALPETRLDIVTPATEFPADFALSPDGRQIVFVASDDSGVSQLWLRSLASTTAQPVPGTEGALQPFWAPDGRAIGFFADGFLKRVNSDGSAPQTLATLTGSPRSGTWGADNILLFSSSLTPDLTRVSATGGEAMTLTTARLELSVHLDPYFLPDGQRFLFYTGGTPDSAGIYLGNLNGTAPVMLTAAGSGARFHPDGWMLWVRNGALTAQRLDLEQATLAGEPLTVADGVMVSSFNLSALSVASTGLIAYRTGINSGQQLVWVDRTGTVLGTAWGPDINARGGVAGPLSPRLSADGLRVAVSRSVQGNGDIWLLDGMRPSRFTFDAAPDIWPLWSPDGSRIVFRSHRLGGGNLYQKPSNGASEETLLVSFEGLMTPNSWSTDGRFLLYHTINTQIGIDIWAVPMTGDPVPFVVLQTPFDERAAAFSPDGRWVAYHSNASGRNEVYVRAFIAPVDADASAATALSGLWQVSTAGGINPIWSSEGHELFYLDPDGNMVAAPINIAGDVPEVGAPIVLFPSRILGGGTEGGQSRQYDVAPDGRFLINTVVGDGATAPITLIQNWNPEAVY